MFPILSYLYLTASPAGFVTLVRLLSPSYSMEVTLPSLSVTLTQFPLLSYSYELNVPSGFTILLNLPALYSLVTVLPFGYVVFTSLPDLSYSYVCTAPFESFFSMHFPSQLYLYSMYAPRAFTSLDTFPYSSYSTVLSAPDASATLITLLSPS